MPLYFTENWISTIFPFFYKHRHWAQECGKTCAYVFMETVRFIWRPIQRYCLCLLLRITNKNKYFDDDVNATTTATTTCACSTVRVVDTWIGTVHVSVLLLLLILGNIDNKQKGMALRQNVNYFNMLSVFHLSRRGSVQLYVW